MSLGFLGSPALLFFTPVYVGHLRLLRGCCNGEPACLVYDTGLLHDS